MTEEPEEYIGSVGNIYEDVTITSTNIVKTYCSNCKRNQHCIHGTIGKDTDTIMLKDKCSNDLCECRCRRFYSDRNGKLRKLGTIDDSDPLEGFNLDQKREAIDDIIDLANATMKVIK